MTNRKEVPRNIIVSVPGWGADLDPARRPGVPMENRPPSGTGAHWTDETLERQVPETNIFHSTEHRGLTPVFGSTCPPKGLSGLIRRYAYTLSEGRKFHWMLLLFADRVDMMENLVGSFLRLHPDHPFKEMGWASEFVRGRIRSRFGQRRSDSRRQGMELLLLTGVLALAYYLGRPYRASDFYRKIKNTA